MLDVLALISQVLGQRLSVLQMGLLLPGTLAEVFALTGTMKDFTALTNDYVRVLNSMPNAVSIEKYAQVFAADMRALFTDPWEQTMLSDLLWKMEGKVISHERILSVIQGFEPVQFELAVTDFIVDTVLTQAAIFDQSHLPIIVLQTPITITPTPKPTPTAKPTPTPKPTPTAKPTPKPTPTPTLPPTPTRPPAVVPTVVVTVVVTIMATSTR
jgi:hypothetical protein